MISKISGGRVLLFRISQRLPVTVQSLSRRLYHERHKSDWQRRSNQKTWLRSERSSLYGTSDNMDLTLQVVSNGYLNTTKSCVISTETNKILVNCGEGTERVVSQNQIGIKNLRSVLLTRFDWPHMGGLHGVSTFLVGCLSHPKMLVHAPVNMKLEDRTRTLKKYFVAKEMQLSQHNYAAKGDYEADSFRVQKLDMTHTPESFSSVWSYLINFKKPAPNIAYEKLEALKSKYQLKQGPWIGDLKKGIDYRDPNTGQVLIKSEDVLDFTNSTEKKILILDVPDLASLNRLQSSNLLLGPSVISKLDLVVHFANSHILNSEPYQNWLNSAFSTRPECIHVFLDERFPNIDLKDCYEFQSQLNLVHDRVFKLLPVQLDSFRQEMSRAKTEWKETHREKYKVKIVQGQTGMKFSLRPETSLSLNDLIHLDNKRSRAEVFDYFETRARGRLDFAPTNEEKAILAELKKRAEELDKDERPVSKLPERPRYPRVLFLGTASSTPTGSRNLSAILVSTTDSCNILLDCGEFTAGQMAKYFDPSQLDSELVKIKAIYFSHAHLDHYNGLIGLLNARESAFKRLNLEYEKPYIFFPKTLSHMLNIGSAIMLSGKLNSLAQIIPNEIILHDKEIRDRLIAKNQYLATHRNLDVDRVFQQLNLLSMHTVQVEHIQDSYGICLRIRQDESVEDKHDFKLVYSGDCRPSKDLVRVGKDCDLLIHECTFDNASHELAVKAAHSTLGEALQVSKDMNAKYTVMTHFSARFAKFFVNDVVDLDKCGFAFDFMCLTPDDFGLLNKKLIDRLTVIFKERVVGYEDKINKMNIKRMKLSV